MIKRWLVLFVLVGGLAVLSRPLFSSTDSAPANLGAKVTDFTLTEPRDQKPVALADYKDRKAVVVVFVGTECPINTAYLPRLSALQQQYGPRGVQFLAINSNEQDTPERVAAHARKHALPFPVLKDDGHKIADLFGAQRTPEVFLLDAARSIQYRGRIDDQYGVGYQKPNPTTTELVTALDELLAGKPVTQSVTSVSGCVIARAVKPKTDGSVTYARDVSRILQRNCQECHREGQIGPMALLSYEDAANWSETIREVVEQQRMPPWHADPRYSKFSNDRRMASEDREALLRWIAQGCPKGDDKDLPPPRQFDASSWRIGKPDVVLSMAEEFDVPAQAPKYGVPYKYFDVQTNFKEDRWVARAEAKAEAGAVVHHIVVFIVPPGKEFTRDDPRAAVLCGTAPGDMPLIAPDGAAKRVPAGSKLVLQMHYTPNGTAQKDRSSVGLVFAKMPPEREILTVPILNPRFEIPPGDDNYQVESRYTFREDSHILSFMPHMHVRGKDFLIEVTYPDGKTETVLSVPHFDFGWQSAYRLVTPLAAPKGTKVHCIAHFDNSTKNLNNPDPKQTVYWGDQTWEEMMIGWMDWTPDRKPR
jgi:peroxiredoxin